MVKEQYSVSLEKENVDKALLYAKFYGGKLSPILDSLLEDWVKDKDNKLGVGE